MTASGGGFDLAAQQHAVDDLEQRSAAPELWNNPQAAQQLMRQLSQTRAEVERWTSMEQQLTSLAELLEMAEAEGDASIIAEISAEAAMVTTALDALEVAVLLGAPYDDRDAFLSIKAGMGGTDAQDWAEMMLRMYARWAERRDFTVNIVDQSEGDEAGIKSATLEIRGAYAYGFAKAEAGVHRLIRLSPFNSGNTRQTSFALVEVLPEVDDAPEVVDQARRFACRCLSCGRPRRPGRQHHRFSGAADI